MKFEMSDELENGENFMFCEYYGVSRLLFLLVLGKKEERNINQSCVFYRGHLSNG